MFKFVILHVIWISLFDISYSFKVTKLNVNDDSGLDLECIVDSKIHLLRVDYKWNTDCTITENEYLEKYICHGVNGRCTQTFKNLIPEANCSTSDDQLQVDFQFDCIEDVDNLRLKSYCDSRLAKISCPRNTFIHLNSIEYWRIYNNISCTETKEECLTVTKPEILMDVCEGQMNCRKILPKPDLKCPDNVDEFGFNIHYNCLKENMMVDICAKDVIPNSDNTSIVYIISPSYINKNRINYTEPICNGVIKGYDMTVTLMLFSFPVVETERAHLTFQPSKSINQSAIIVDQIIYSGIDQFRVDFEHKNLTTQTFLILVNASTNGVEIDYTNLVLNDSIKENDTSHNRTAIPQPSTEPVPYDTASKIDMTTSGLIDDGKSTPLDSGRNDGIVIGAIVGSVLLISITIFVIYCICRNRIKKSKTEDRSDLRGSENPGFIEDYKLFEPRNVKAPSVGLTNPQYQTSIPIDTTDDQIDNDETEPEDLSYLSSDPNYADIITFNTRPTLEEDLTFITRPTLEEDLTFITRPTLEDMTFETRPTIEQLSDITEEESLNSEYAKIKKRGGLSNDIQIGSMFDNSYNNIVPPIPIKTWMVPNQDHQGSHSVLY